VPSAVGPSQSPHTTISVVTGISGRTVAASVPRWSTPSASSTSPVGAITAEMPVLVARSCGRRVSMLRNAAPTRCRRGPDPSANHESLDSVTISSAPRRAAPKARRGSRTS